MPQRIMVVDDEEGMRLALKEVLTRAGYEVILAENGREALDLLTQVADGQPAYDLVLSDVRMPQLDGQALLERIQQLPAPPPVAIMTAFGALEDAVQAMRSGARDYLLKPFSSDTVEQVVSRVLREARETATATATPAEADKPSAKNNGRGNDNGRRNGGRMIAVDPRMKHLLALAGEVADSDATIMILGESGTGKEVLARYIHQQSARRERPFVAVNCAALPEGLLESELFGHVKGSFTGAILSRKGHFELANHGTILLDEISEMPLSLQAKLLRVLQEREIQPVGASETLRLDIRVLATSNRKIEEVVESGQFRQDLYYRLNVITLEIPPLRQRPGDITPLAEHFLTQLCRRNRRPLKKIGRELEAHLLKQPWKGNVRELENFMERAVLLCKEEVIQPDNIFLERFDPRPPTAATTLDYGASAPGPEAPPRSMYSGPSMTLEEMEKGMILSTLEKVNGNRTRAADLLGVSVRTIRNKLHHYGLAKTV